MITFVDKDEQFVAWRDGNPDGFIVNHKREPDSSYLVLQLATCRDLSGDPLYGRGSNWTSSYGKTCSTRRSELESWAHARGGELHPCGHCHT